MRLVSFGGIVIASCSVSISLGSMVFAGLFEASFSKYADRGGSRTVLGNVGYCTLAVGV